MASLPLINVKLWRGDLDASGQSNQADLQLLTEALEDPAFGLTDKRYVVGLDSIDFRHEGSLSYGDGEIEPALWSAQGDADHIMSLALDTTESGAVTAGDRVYVFRSIQSNLSRGGQAGQIHKFTVTAQGSGLHGRGLVLEPAAVARTTTFDSTGQEVGAVAAAETLMGSLHVLAASGTTPTLDVVVESDVDVNFASPTTRLTFGQQTGLESDWQSASGAITDTFYRIAGAIGGTTPSFTFAVCLGIGT